MRFVVIAARRTGSTHLANMLRRHPDILCHGEVFHRRRMWLHWPKADLDGDTMAQLLELRRAAPASFLERVYTRSYGRDHVGFKIFSGQDDAALTKLVSDSAVRKIVLYRTNVLANFSSDLAARAAGQWSIRKGGERPQAVKVQFVEQEFRAFHDEYVSFYRRAIEALNASRQVFHVIRYDELNQQGFIAGLVSFIGADPSRLASDSGERSGHVKANPSDILSRFTNPETAREFLGDLGLLHWAHEGEASLALLGDSQEIAG